MDHPGHHSSLEAHTMGVNVYVLDFEVRPVDALLHSAFRIGAGGGLAAGAVIQHTEIHILHRHIADVEDLPIIRLFLGPSSQLEHPCQVHAVFFQYQIHPGVADSGLRKVQPLPSQQA